MTPQEAISAPRFNHIEGTKVGLEPEFSESVKNELTRRGHEVVGRITVTEHGRIRESAPLPDMLAWIRSGGTTLIVPLRLPQ